MKESCSVCRTSLLKLVGKQIICHLKVFLPHNILGKQCI